MKPTAEDLKLVAEAMGIYKEIVEDHKVPWQPLITNEGNVWNPTEDAEQCIKLLEWLDERNVAIEIKRHGGGKYRKTSIWLYSAGYIHEIDGRPVYYAENKDFKTAVFLAVVEYIKNKK